MDQAWKKMKTILKHIKAKFCGEQDLDKLIRRGLTIGKDFTRMGGVIIDPSHCWHISIGDHVTLAPRVHILAHDASTKLFLNYTLVENTRIGNNVFVGAGSIVLPGVTIGNNVVIGAGSVVSQSIPDDSVAVGNPARVVKSLSAFLEENKQRMSSETLFGKEYTLRNERFGEEERNELLKACKKHGVIYVE